MELESTAAPPVLSPGTQEGRLARALYTNKPEDAKELFFRKGDILTVLQIDHEGQVGWWYCSLHGKKGMCPGNYLEVIEDKYSFVEKPLRRTSSIEDAMETYDVPRSYKQIEMDPTEFYDVPRTSNGEKALPIPKLKSGNSKNSFMSTTNSVRSSSAFSSSSSSSGSGVSSTRNSGCGDGFGVTLDQPLYVNEFELGRRSAASLNTDRDVGRDLLGRSVEEELGTIMAAVATIQELYEAPRSSAESSSFNSSSSGNRVSTISMSSGPGHSIGTKGSRDSLDRDGEATYENCFEDYDVPRSVRPSRPTSIVSQRSVHGFGSSRFAFGLNRNMDGRRMGESNAELNNHGARGAKPALPKKVSGSLANLPLGNSHNHNSNNGFGSRPVRRMNNGARDWSRSDMELRRHGCIQPVSPSVNFANIDEDKFKFNEVRLRHKSGGAELETAVSVDSSAHEVKDEAVLQRPRASFRTSGNFWGSSASLDRRSSRVDSISDDKFLPLKHKAAVTVCEKLKHEVVTSVKALMEFVRPGWRSKNNLNEVMPDFKFAAIRLNLAAKDIVEFCSQSLSNAKKYTNRATVVKLQRLFTAVANGAQIIQRDVDELEAYFWSSERLSIARNDSASANDALEQLVLCSTALSHDVTEITNFIFANATSLYIDHPSLTESKTVTEVPTQKETKIPKGESTGPEEDYDYVSLVPVSDADDSCRAEGACSPNKPELNPMDLQLLETYTAQVSDISPLLSQAISTFITSIQKNETPKLFNAHLKLVILLSYKMLFAGDTIHRNMSEGELRGEIENKSNDLHKSIVALHEASRVAMKEALTSPPKQNIVDRVYSTTAAATQLKKLLVESTPLL